MRSLARDSLAVQGANVPVAREKSKARYTITVEAGAKIRWPLFHLNYTAFFLGLTLSEIRSESEQSDILTR